MTRFVYKAVAYVSFPKSLKHNGIFWHPNQIQNDMSFMKIKMISCIVIMLDICQHKLIALLINIHIALILSVFLSNFV